MNGYCVTSCHPHSRYLCVSLRGQTLGAVSQCVSFQLAHIKSVYNVFSILSVLSHAMLPQAIKFSSQCLDQEVPNLRLCDHSTCVFCVKFFLSLDLHSIPFLDSRPETCWLELYDVATRSKQCLLLVFTAFPQLTAGDGLWKCSMTSRSARALSISRRLTSYSLSNFARCVCSSTLSRGGVSSKACLGLGL